MLQYTYHNTMSTTSKHHLQHCIPISQNSLKYVPLATLLFHDKESIYDSIYINHNRSGHKISTMRGKSPKPIRIHHPEYCN